MLIKMKLPEKYPHSHSCEYWHGFTCDCEAGTQHNCLAEIEELNQPLVRGMEIDVEAFAKEMFEVCVYPGLEKWEEQTNHIKTRWRTNAEIIRDNAHVWLKEKDTK